MRQLPVALALLSLAVAAASVGAQNVQVGVCATPDSVAFRGQNRLTDDVLRADVGIAPRSTINSRVLTRAMKDLYATNQFESNIQVTCEEIAGKAVLIFNLQERRILSDVRVDWRREGVSGRRQRPR